MFTEIRKCLDDFEDAFKKYEGHNHEEEVINAFEFFEMHLAEAIMKNKLCNASKLARFIMAAKGFEIKI